MSFCRIHRTSKPLLFAFAVWWIFAPATPILPEPATNIDARKITFPADRPGSLTLFVDPNGEASAADLFGHPERFTAPANGGTPAYGETSATIWARMMVHNNSATSSERFLEIGWPHLDRVELYIFDEYGRVLSTQTAGVELGFAYRPIRSRFFVFPVELPAMKTRTILLRARASGNLQLPLTLWTDAELREKERSSLFIQGIYFGIVGVMFLYNFFLFLAARDRSYLFYVLYVFCFLLVQLGFTGIGFQYIWPDYPWLQLRYFPLFTGLTLISSLTFTRIFLDTAKYAPRMDRLLLAFVAFGPIFLALGLFAPPAISNHICTILTPLPTSLLLIIAVIVARSGSRAARYFLLAFSMVVTAIAITTLRTLRILPVSFLTENGMQLGAIADVVLLSFALGDRISSMRVENERSERASRTQRQKLLVIGRELDIARRIQSAVVQKTFPTVEGLAIASRFVPMSHVGGDFYDFHKTGPSSSCFVLADVSGHGVPAALIASMAQISFELQQSQAAHPRRVLEGMNDILLGRMGDYFLSAGCAHVDAGEMILRVASAGHPSLLLCRPGTDRPMELRPPGRLIGPFENPTLEQLEMQLVKGDRLIMFSDAILEARNSEGALFGMRRLKTLARENYVHEADDFAHILQSKVLEWVNATQLDDDFTLMVVDIRRN